MIAICGDYPELSRGFGLSDIIRNMLRAAPNDEITGIDHMRKLDCRPGVRTKRKPI